MVDQSISSPLFLNMSRKLTGSNSVSQSLGFNIFTQIFELSFSVLTASQLHPAARLTEVNIDMELFRRLFLFLWDASWFALQTLWTEATYLAQSSSHSISRPSMEQQVLAGECMVLTGGSSGIGLEICRQWLTRGGICVVLSRSKPQIQNSDETRLRWIPCDLASFENVHAAADEILEQNSGGGISSLVCCAGTMMPDPSLRSADGHDLSFQVNHLSHALLSLRLANLLGSSGSIIFLSSVAHVAARGILNLPNSNTVQGRSHPAPICRYTSASTAYAESKLANIMWASALARHMAQHRPARQLPAIASLHPGVVNTRLYQHLPPPLSWLQATIAPHVFRDASHPASEVVDFAVAALSKVASARDPRQQMGMYYVRGQHVAPTSASKDHVLEDALWAYTLKLVGLSAIPSRALLGCRG